MSLRLGQGCGKRIWNWVLGIWNLEATMDLL